MASRHQVPTSGNGSEERLEDILEARIDILAWAICSRSAGRSSPIRQRIDLSAIDGQGDLHVIE